MTNATENETPATSQSLLNEVERYLEEKAQKAAIDGFQETSEFLFALSRKTYWEGPGNEKANVSRETAVKAAGFREDFRTGQYVPTVDGRDVSPTSYDPERALRIAEEHIANRSK